jgi:hypothetical protein
MEAIDYFEIGERAIPNDEPDYNPDVGTVVKIGRKWIYLRMDRTGKIKKFDPDDLGTVGDNPGHSDVALYAWLKHLGHSEEAIRNWYPGFAPGKVSKAAVARLHKVWGLHPKI